MGIDATRKWPQEGVTREFPKKLTTTDAVRTRAEQIWSRLK
jgi:4-hydroxy-3-polyprenylbenzoate decarboxylase